jgi:hypothetical protein
MAIGAVGSQQVQEDGRVMSMSMMHYINCSASSPTTADSSLDTQAEQVVCVVAAWKAHPPRFARTGY